MDSWMCDRGHHTPDGQEGFMTEHEDWQRRRTQARGAADLCSFLAPSALEAFSQLPMAVRGSSKITQGGEEMPQRWETLSELLSCSPIRLKPPWSHGHFPPGDCRAKIRGFVKEQECGGLRGGGVEAFEHVLQTRQRRPCWLRALLLSSMCPSEIC